jgi:hypothetical protein
VAWESVQQEIDMSIHSPNHPLSSPPPGVIAMIQPHWRTALAGILALCLMLPGFSPAVAQQRASLPTAQQTLAAPSTSEGATCTSTDGKATCSCSAPGGKCQAKATSCSCYGVAPPTPSSSTPRGPSALSATSEALEATCTSGDGKKVCACGDQGCNAAEVSCGCLGH